MPAKGIASSIIHARPVLCKRRDEPEDPLNAGAG
jgi:hypothetical protein